VTEISESVTRLIDQMATLPGIGKKTAERLAYHMLHLPKEKAMLLAEAIRDVKENVRYCSRCFNLAEGELCSICADEKRNKRLLCIVEQPRDLIALEKTGQYEGLYHVLLGRIAPLEKIDAGDLTIDALIDRVRGGEFDEIIMATNPNLDGDGTAFYIQNLLQEFPVTITRLARGITTGSVLEFANNEILSDALAGRQKL
jgi:recombination protein RecR